MSTSLLCHFFSVRAYDDIATKYERDEINFKALPKPSMVYCPNCLSYKVKRRGSYNRKLRLSPAGGTSVHILIKVPQYLTVVLDLDSGKVIFVGDGKGADALLPFWKRLKKSHAKIKAIATDLGAAYISAVLGNCANAVLVFDHFHVVKLMNEKLSEVRRKLFHEVKDIFEKKVLKGSRWLLLKNPENLNEERNEKQRLTDILELNKPLAIAYYMKEDLRQIWSQPDKATAQKILDGWVEVAKTSGIGPLIKMGQTVAKYSFGILNWYDHPISSGPLEGTNNKIKTLKRQANGYRGLDFFKLRIMAIHEAKYALTG